MYGKKSSSGDFGTLRHFQILLNRSNVKQDTKKAVDANLEFYLTVVKGHLLAYACKVLGCSKLDDTLVLPQGIKHAPIEQQWEYLSNLAGIIVKECTLIDISSDIEDTQDRVYNYARNLCHYGALLLELKDAWAEGDGERVFRSWKLMMPHFKASGRHKYALEALRFQFQVNSTLSPRLAHQAKWDRFVNVKGGKGQNIPTDLYNEHVVKLLKRIIRTMGPNLTEKAMQRSARSVSTVFAISKQYDKESGVPIITTAHSTKSDAADIAKIIDVVLKEDILNIKPGRSHKKFKTIRLNPLWNLNKEKVLLRIEKRKKEMEKYHTICTALKENEDGEDSENDEWDDDEWDEDNGDSDLSGSEQVEECIAEYSEGMEDLMDAIVY